MILRYAKGSSDKVSEHFKAREFDCRCKNTSCRGTYINLNHVYNLEQLRNLIGKPLKLSSAYRCAEHNFREKGKPTSWHVAGCATDVVCPEGLEFDKFLADINLIGFDQVIPYEEQNFVHVVTTK